MIFNTASVFVPVYLCIQLFYVPSKKKALDSKHSNDGRGKTKAETPTNQIRFRNVHNAIVTIGLV